MKKNLLFLLIVLFSTIFAQNWEKKLTQSNQPINDVFFLNENIGWAGGSTGTLLKTSDAGNTWETVTLPIVGSVYSIYFLNEQVGWVGLSSDILLSTTDGGANWSQQAISSIGGSIFSIYFSDEHTGWALTSSSSVGEVWHTTDGANWTRGFQNTGEIEDMSFSSPNHGICVGGGSGKLDIYYTSDGLTWTKATNPTLPVGMYTRTDIRGVTMVNDNFAFAVGWGSVAVGYQPSILIKSTDGGATWQLMQQSSENAAVVNMYCVDFKDEQNGVAFGGGAYEGTVGLRTIDGGTTWFQIDPPFGFTGKTMSLIADQIIIAGSGGGIAKSSDFGDNWELLTKVPSLTPYIFKFIDENTAFAAGYNGLVLKTSDSGENWTASYSSVNMVCPTINDLDFVDENIGFLAKRNRQVCKTSDGGNTWDAIIPDTSATSFYNNGISFVNENFGCVVGRAESGISLMYLTDDGGNTWEEKIATFPDELNRVKFFDVNNGIVIGDASISYTTENGGENWTPSTIINLPSIYAGTDFEEIHFYNENLGILASDCLLKTLDGGKTWEYVEIPNLADNLVDCVMFNENTWVVAGDDFVYRTNDSGANWEDITFSPEIDATSLWQISKDGKGHIWLAGSSSSMYKSVAIVSIEDIRLVADEFYLSQNYPNPFNPNTIISFSIPESQNNSNCKLVVYNILGKEIKTLINQQLNSGFHQIDFDADEISSGVYFYQLTINNLIQTKKMMLIK